MDIKDIFSFDQVEYRSVSDEQARALGLLTINFNFLESTLEYAIAHIIDPNQEHQVKALINANSFSQKIERLEALVQWYRSDIVDSPIWSGLSDNERAWAERDFQNGTELLRRLRAANKFRNQLVHTRIQPGRLDEEHATLLSAKNGVQITSEPARIEKEARIMAALAISTMFFGQHMRGSIRNFNRVKYGEAAARVP